MGLLFLALVLALVGELLWFKFYRNGKKEFNMYDKEHSNVTVLNEEELVSKLNKISNLGISNITSEFNQVSFVCNKNTYAINIENDMAFVEYDMSGCEVRVSLIGRLTRRIKFWKSAHKAMLINMIMDTLQNDCSSEQKPYKKTKGYAKASVAALVLCLIFLVFGIFSFTRSTYDKAISDAKTMEFYNNVTYEEVIDTYVKDAEWTAFNGEGDTAIVEINGTSVEGEKICIQFSGDMGMGLSYRSLTLSYFEADGISVDPDEAMEYIYLNYYGVHNSNNGNNTTSNNSSSWTLNNHTDEFGMATGKQYLSTTVSGSFDNMLGANQTLKAELQVSPESVNLVLWEYGTSKLEALWDDGNQYIITLLDQNNQKHKYLSYLRDGKPYLAVGEYDIEGFYESSADLTNILKTPGTVKFHIVNSDDKDNTYSFSVKTDGFAELYEQISSVGQ